MNENLLQMMQMDLDGSIGTHNEAIARIKYWNAVIDGAGTAETRLGKSKMVSRSIKKIVENSLASLVEPFLNPTLISAQGKDVESDGKADAVAKLLNYQWNYGNNTLKTVEKLIRTLVVDGTVFTKCGWNDDNPSIEIMDADAVIVDHSADDFKNVRFVIERKKVMISDILDNPEWYGRHTLDSLSPLTATSSTGFDREEVGKDNNVNFEDRLRQLIQINTYYGKISMDGELKSIVGIWSDDFLINVLENVYPKNWNGNPFSVEVYTRVVGSIYGESVASSLEVNQEIETGIQRSILNTLDASTNGQKGSRKGSIDPLNLKKFREGKWFEFNGQSPEIWEGHYQEIPPHLYNLLDRTQKDSEELSGISRLNGGLDPRALNSNVSATAASLTNTASERRLLLITRHISSVLEDCFRKWIDLNIIMLERGSIRLGDSLVDVTGEDLDGSYDLDIRVATSGARQEKAQQLTLVIQQLAQNPNIPQSMVMRLTGELVEAMGMYAVAEELGGISQQMKQQEAQPQQPNPQQMMAEQVMLEAQKATIAKDNAKATLDEAKAVESYVDSQNKSYGL